MSKGSKRRKIQVTTKQFNASWDDIFKRLLQPALDKAFNVKS